ncbi:hypothetical protein [Anaeromicrobium sediminis]|uniref:hypothetical protein n=1 Tax=Anaeromicrobium sediminis TaxID=1478221 RepID=UPI001FA88E85|nr:hypothetical protein [Anaeromicrobium sediminis]
MKKRITSVLLALALSFTVSYGHSGRTDCSGGHHDNKNKSGLGSYHYHHGYGPHLHENGVCPYEVKNTVEACSSPVNTVTMVKKAPTVNSNEVKVTLVNYPVQINGVTIDNSKQKYPIISYNNITYLPLTWNNGQALGFRPKWREESKSLHIYLEETEGKLEQELLKEETNSSEKSYTCEKVDFDVYIDYYLVSGDSEYPVLNYKGIIYLPLTSDNVTKLGISFVWSNEEGIKIRGGE